MIYSGSAPSAADSLVEVQITSFGIPEFRTILRFPVYPGIFVIGSSDEQLRFPPDKDVFPFLGLCGQGQYYILHLPIHIASNSLLHSLCIFKGVLRCFILRGCSETEDNIIVINVEKSLTRCGPEDVKYSYDVFFFI